MPWTFLCIADQAQKNIGRLKQTPWCQGPYTFCLNKPNPAIVPFQIQVTFTLPKPAPRSPAHRPRLQKIPVFCTADFATAQHTARCAPGTGCASRKVPPRAGEVRYRYIYIYIYGVKHEIKVRCFRKILARSPCIESHGASRNFTPRGVLE